MSMFEQSSKCKVQQRDCNSLNDKAHHCTEWWAFFNTLTQVWNELVIL